MVSSSSASGGGKLTELQRSVLGGFFEREGAFFLTGGAALVGFHLGHRTTKDLDLFTHDAEAFERGIPTLRDVARALGLTVEIRQDAPGFKRVVLTSADDALVVDLVLDETRPARDRVHRDAVTLDSMAEILANKLTTLVSRSEERDLVDVMFLERGGLTVEEALPRALEKDGGCTPAQLAWLLSQIRIPDGASLPGGVDATELRDYLSDLIRRLRRAALPPPS